MSKVEILQSSKSGDVLKTETIEGSVHSYSQEEKIGIVEHINSVLQNDADLANIVPINPNNEDIFHVIRDGILLWYGCIDPLFACPYVLLVLFDHILSFSVCAFCTHLCLSLFCSKLINAVTADTIPSAKINMKKNLSFFECVTNLDRALDAARSLGLVVVNIGAQDLYQGRVPVCSINIHSLSAPHTQSSRETEQNRSASQSRAIYRFGVFFVVVLNPWFIVATCEGMCTMFVEYEGQWSMLIVFHPNYAVPVGFVASSRRHCVTQ
jgi:hypothetical protein